MAGERPALQRPRRLSGRLEGEPGRVVRVGEAFCEPGGDVIRYQNGNNRDGIPVRFTVTMLGEPGKPASHQAYGPLGGRASPMAVQPLTDGPLAGDNVA